MRSWGRLAGVAILAASACGGGTDDAGPTTEDAPVDLAEEPADVEDEPVDPAEEPAEVDDGATGDGGDAAEGATGEVVRTAVSADGVLTVTVPDSSDVTPTIAPTDPPADLPDDVSVLAYELGPDGAVFDEPVQIELVLPPEELTSAVALILESSDGVAESLPLDRTAFGADGVTLSASVDHFSNLSVWTFGDGFGGAVSIETMDGIVDLVPATARATVDEGAIRVSLSDTLSYAFSPDELFPVEDEFTEIGAPGGEANIQCQREGKFRIAWDVDVVYSAGADLTDETLASVAQLPRDFAFAPNGDIYWARTISGRYACLPSLDSIVEEANLVHRQGVGEVLALLAGGEPGERTPPVDDELAAFRFYAEDDGDGRGLTVTVPLLDGSTTTVALNLIALGTTTDGGFLEVIGGVEVALDDNGVLSDQSSLMLFRDGAEVESDVELQVETFGDFDDDGRFELGMAWDANAHQPAIRDLLADSVLGELNAVVNGAITVQAPDGSGTRYLPDNATPMDPSVALDMLGLPADL